MGDDGDAVAAVETGIRDQRLIIEGWFASHADSGTAGPHVHLRTSDRRDAVLRTDQVPALVDGLSLVAERIDRAWATDGADYPFADAPDDNDPVVIRQRRIEHLEFLDKLHAQLPEVVRILLLAQDIHDASHSIAELLDVDFMQVQARLNAISLFALTRTPTAARAERLEDLRRQQ